MVNPAINGCNLLGTPIVNQLSYPGTAQAGGLPRHLLQKFPQENFAQNIGLSFFFFFFGVYTPDQPKAMRRPCSLPLKGSVHPWENRLHKCAAFRAKEMSKEIPPSTTTPTTGPSPIKVCLCLHALSGPPLTYMNSSTTTPLPALP